MKISNCRRSVLFLYALQFLTAVANGQSTTTQNRDEEPYKLSPFTVSTEKDNGYIAADTIAAGRLSTNLLKTPADITVVTRQFMDDLGSVTLNEAASWLTSAGITELNAENRDFGSGVTFRGLTTNPNTRNYFKNGTTPEEYIVDRIEGARGPNTILYGDSLMGGQVNYITKRALTYDFQKYRFRTDSEGSVSLTADINIGINDRVAIRLNGFAQNGKNWIDRYFDDRYFGAVALTYRPWKGAQVRFEGESGYTKRMNRIDYFLDQSSGWNGVYSVGALLTAATPAGSGVARLGNTYVYVPGLGVMNWANLGRTSGTNVALSPDGSRSAIANLAPAPRQSFNVQPDDTVSEINSQNVSLYFEQQFDSGLIIELAGEQNITDRGGTVINFNSVYRDVNQILPDGRTNPNYGSYFSQGALKLNTNTTDKYTSGRVAANYPIRASNFTQNISAIAQARRQVFNVNNYQYMRVNGPNANVTAAENAVMLWNYWDDIASDIPLPQDDAIYKYKYIPTRETTVRHNLESLQFNTVGSYFSNRLTFIGGVRFDRYNGNSRDIATRSTTTGDVLSFRRITADAEITSKSYGIVYFPVKWLGVFANRSDGFTYAIQNLPQLAGAAAYSSVPSTVEAAGLRINLLDGRLVGSAGYYHSKERNRNQTVATTNVNALWTSMGLLDKRILGGSYASYIDTIDAEGQGWEAEATANLSNTLRVTGNIAFPQTEQTNAAPASKAYYAANQATWEAWVNNPSNPTRVADAANLATYANIISGFADGRVQNGTFKYRMNLFANYIVRSGKGQGIRLGFGTQLFGRRLIGNVANNPLNYVYMDSYHTETASIGYSVKLRNNQTLEVQLNVNNLLDYDDPVYTAVAVAGGVTYRNTYAYVPPRNVRLTVSLAY